MSSTLTAEEAARLLGISRATLYSYVSRGMLRSVEQASNTREKRYLKEDIDKLLIQKEQRKNPAEAVRSALHFGTPMLDTSISLLREGQLFYRGQEVVHLAQNHTFEEVMGLLWTGELAPLPEVTPLELPDGFAENTRHLKVLPQYQRALLEAQAQDLGALNLKTPSLLKTGQKALGVLAQTTTGWASQAALSVQLCLHWTHGLENQRLVDQTLILCAEHELNISAFSVRCAVSASSDLYAALIAGLSALQGRKHGGMVPAVDRLLQEGLHSGVKPALHHLLSEKTGLPGFSHPLYPQGDPRARFLWERLQEAPLDPQLRAVSTELQETVWQELEEHPNIDFALAVLARHLGHPIKAGMTLFALGRAAGWVAHAIEQHQDGRLIRPRANYVGLPVQSD